MKPIALFFTIFMAGAAAQAQSIRGVPTLPKGGIGLTGSAGAGFADFRILSPKADYKLDRGTYVAGSVERGFEFLHLYLTFGLSYLDSTGIANYKYTNLSSSTSYTLNDVNFKSKTYEVSLGLKFKLIDEYWFRPYVEGGGVGNYNEVTYSSQINSLTTTGGDYKTKDVIMGSGYYGEGGIELQFAEKFGIKLAARQTVTQTKKLETLNGRSVRLIAETYYLSALIGF